MAAQSRPVLSIVVPLSSIRDEVSLETESSTQVAVLMLAIENAIDDAPEPEPIVAGQIAVGRVVFESLAAALEPYPRKPGAVLDWQAPLPADAAATTATSPFAVLANLKTKS